MIIEYKEFFVDVVVVLKEWKQCKGEVVVVIVQGVLLLFNYWIVIQ